MRITNYQLSIISNKILKNIVSSIKEYNSLILHKKAVTSAEQSVKRSQEYKDYIKIDTYQKECNKKRDEINIIEEQKNKAINNFNKKYNKNIGGLFNQSLLFTEEELIDRKVRELLNAIEINENKIRNSIEETIILSNMKNVNEMLSNISENIFNEIKEDQNG